MSTEMRSMLAGAFMALALSACAPLYEGELPTVQPVDAYDELYPHYVQLCALSQIRAKFARHGASPGHAAMYIKGACRDPVTPFPTLEPCDPESNDLGDGETGTGVSVNKMLKNVNWIAIPGRRLFIHGNMEPYHILDKESGLATMWYAVGQGIFDGVEIHGEYLPPDDDDEALDYLHAAEVLGTDYALAFGRTVFCSRLPMTRPMLVDAIEYLNDLNREYALGEADYNWSGYYDNCSHTLRNSLAAAGVWEPKSVNSFKLRQLFNLSVPANEFAKLAVLSTSFPIEDFDAVYRNDVMRDTLVKHGWLPTRHGALLERIPVHQNNELWETDVRIFVLESPFLRGKSSRVGKLFNERRNTDVETNLLYFRERYRKILAGRPEDWNSVAEGDDYAMVRERYYEYMQESLADVEAKLRELYTSR